VHRRDEDALVDHGTIVVRPAEPRDARVLDDIYNHYVRTSHVTFDIEPASIDRRRDWLRERSGGRHRVLVAQDARQVLGYASSGPHRSRPGYATTVETSVYVDPACTGRGVGASLYRELFEALRYEDLHRALAGIALPNPASVALHRRFAFTQVALFTQHGRKFGRYWDVAWFERALP
jgi:phosphinothricin acetyltransferase